MRSKPIKINFRLTAEQYEYLKRKAKEAGDNNVSAVCARLIEEARREEKGADDRSNVTC